MQFRLQSHRVQLIRTRYDAEKKRNVQVRPLLSFHQYDQPGQDIWGELNDEETRQLRDWLAQRDEQSRRARIEVNASIGAQRLREVAEAVPLMRPEDAPAVWEAIDAVRKALTKAGYRRPAKAPTSAAAPEQAEQG